MPKRKGSDGKEAGSAKKPMLENNKENIQANNVEWPRGRELVSGKIFYIHLKNFMCHGNLRVDLNKRCNVMVGNNGSGKSAILTALIIGLGGKASAAHRSSNVKQLVKHGQSSCTIDIAIANDGIDAFDRDKFGDKIIVQRKITASGGSTYRICNSEGEEMSRDRHLLEKLLLYFNIQIDNPVCILHQDAARSFLKDSDPRRLYVFYMKATQLQDMLDKLAQCLALYRSNKTQYELLLEKVEEDAKAVDKVRQKHRDLSSVNNTKQLLAQLKKELLWVKYNDQRDLHAKIESELRGVDEVVRQLEATMSTGTSRVDEIHRMIEGFREEKTIKQSLMVQIISQYDVAHREYLDERDAEQSQKKTFEIQKQKRQRIEENLKRVMEHLARDNFEEQVAQMKRDNEEKMERLEEKQTEILAISSSLERDVEDLQKILGECDKSVEACRHRKEYLEGELMKVNRESRQIDIETQDELAIYGGHMARLLDTIEMHHKRGEFSKMPRGPFGRYIQVPEAKWRSIVESVIGGYVTAFLVNSHKDHQLLVRIMKKIIPDGRLPSITVTPFEGAVYNFSSGKCVPPRGTHALVDLICVSDHNIMNTLINSLHIETILLTEDMELAMKLTDGSNIPRNLKKILLAKPFQEYAVHPFRMYSMQERPARYIQVNLKDVRESLKNQERSLKADHQKIMQKYNKLLSEKRQQQASVQEKTTKRRSLEEQLKQVDQSIKEIKNVVYPTDFENDALKEEHETLKKAMEKAQNLEKREKDKYLELKSKLEVLLEKKEKLKAEEMELSKQIRQLEESTDKQNSKIASVEYNRRENEAKLAQKQEISQYLTKEVEKQQKAMDGAHQRALKSCPPIDTTRSEETVTALIKEGQASVAHLESLHGTLEELTEQLNQMTQHLERDQEVARILDETLTKLKVMQYRRHQTVIRMKKHTCLMMQHHFSTLLNLRGFKGDVQVDYEAKTLELKVIPRDKNLDRATSSTQSLSGGERSFTTVSFLLSLWNCVNHPFFFLDEYDVFTDPVNRQYMTNLLIRETEKHVWTQYVFLTPQDMSALEANPHLTIHRMADPQ